MSQHLRNHGSQTVAFLLLTSHSWCLPFMSPRGNGLAVAYSISPDSPQGTVCIVSLSNIREWVNKASCTLASDSVFICKGLMIGLFKKVILFVFAALDLRCSGLRWGFSSCGEQGLLSSCSMWASHCGGFSCCGAWALGCMGFSNCGMRALWCDSWALEHRLNSCGTQT